MPKSTNDAILPDITDVRAVLHEHLRQGWYGLGEFTISTEGVSALSRVRLALRVLEELKENGGPATKKKYRAIQSELRILQKSLGKLAAWLPLVDVLIDSIEPEDNQKP